MKNTELRKVTKRLVVSILGCAIVWYFLNTHRAWVWAYFESLMLMPQPISGELSATANASISAITTIAITGITAVAAIVVWFITGNVMALQSMFKFQSLAQTSGSVIAEALNQNATERREETITERIEHVYEEGSEGSPTKRPFSPREYPEE